MNWDYFKIYKILDCDNITHKSASMIKLIKVPAVLVTCLVVVVVSSTWAFLDPTLEPHLRQVGTVYFKLETILMTFDFSLN